MATSRDSSAELADAHGRAGQIGKQTLSDGRALQTVASAVAALALEGAQAIADAGWFSRVFRSPELRFRRRCDELLLRLDSEELGRLFDAARKALELAASTPGGYSPDVAKHGRGLLRKWQPTKPKQGKREAGEHAALGKARAASESAPRLSSERASELAQRIWERFEQIDEESAEFSSRREADVSRVAWNRAHTETLAPFDAENRLRVIDALGELLDARLRDAGEPESSEGRLARLKRHIRQRTDYEFIVTEEAAGYEHDAQAWVDRNRQRDD